MHRPPVTISIAYVHSMLHGVQTQGMAVDVFLADAGIAPELLSQNNARITVAQYVELFKSLVERLDDDLMGFHSRRLKRGSFALMARSAIGAPNLEVAIRRIARAYRLLQDDVLMEILRDGTQAGFTLRYTDPASPKHNFLPELILRVYWQLFVWLTGGKFKVTRFDFAFAPPAYADSYSQVFPGTLRFHCERSGFWFDASFLNCRIVQDEKALFSFLSNAQRNVLLPQKNNALVSSSVRNHLQQTLPSWPGMIETASALHMSPATLQRRLASEGTSFQSLKDALRRDMAIVRLSNSDEQVVGLANELGFSDSASFQRAFKAWTGSAPGAYRRNSANTAQ